MKAAAVPPVLRGRVIARDGDHALVRGEAGCKMVQPAGDLQTGDLVRISKEGTTEVVVKYKGEDYPTPGTEVFRLSEERIAGLRARATILREIRHYFAEQDFLEIQPPVRVPSPGLEINIKAIRSEEMYLITSPEFSMKRLLAGGLERIYATCSCFRSEEEGAHHSLEFTMLEWYRSWASLDEILWDTEQIVSRSMRAVRGRCSALVAGREIDVSTPWQQKTVTEAFSDWAQIALVKDDSATAFKQRIVASGLRVPDDLIEWDDLFYFVFVEKIDPALAALDHAIVLTDWPSPLAALARKKPGHPHLALRFEAYIGGVELANAFDELTDAAEQRQRFEEERQARLSRGLEVYPIDEAFLAALEEGLPPSAGIALGIDRLAMLAAGSDTLRSVSAFVGDEL